MSILTIDNNKIEIKISYNLSKVNFGIEKFK